MPMTELLAAEWRPALGCTEPAAVAWAAALAAGLPSAFAGPAGAKWMGTGAACAGAVIAGAACGWAPLSAAMLAIISRLRRVDSMNGLMKATFMGPRWTWID